MQKANQILPPTVEKNKFGLFKKQSHDYNFQCRLNVETGNQAFK